MITQSSKARKKMSTPLVKILLMILNIFFLFQLSHSSSLPKSLQLATHHFGNHTAISDFRLVNRRKLISCLDPNPYLYIKIVTNPILSDDQMVTVKVGGVFSTSTYDWVGMMSPAHADAKTCLINKAMYVQTGDLKALPLLCDYPVKAQYLTNDPGYLDCKNQECQKRSSDGKCTISTCSGELTFHVTNFRTDIKFYFFGAGYYQPCILAASGNATFANPKQPLYGHINSIDSTGTSMKLTWVSGDKAPQQVQYANGKTVTSIVKTFTPADMCTTPLLPSPAIDFGWHDPGFIHSAVMNGLTPSTSYSYKYGSTSAGWSKSISFKTPPAAGAAHLKFLAYGDMGKTPLDKSDEHYIQPGAVSVINVMVDEVNTGGIDSIYHIGDISYATGFLVEWDYFLHLIEPMASKVAYMTAIGNHERDYLGSGSVYITPDSGGECGVPYETYFPMPTPGKDKPWYSIEQGPVHFTVMSTEHPWTVGSEQYQWMAKDMASVDRTRTPWLVFQGHRPFYTSAEDIPLLPNVDPNFVKDVEPLMLQHKVDVALVGHVHNYERTCAVFQGVCKQMPKKDANGVDTYDFSTSYPSPVHAIIGMAGFELDGFPNNNTWSLSKHSKFGYTRIDATKTEFKLEFVGSETKTVLDSFKITKTNSK